MRVGLSLLYHAINITFRESYEPGRTILSCVSGRGNAVARINMSDCAMDNTPPSPPPRGPYFICFDERLVFTLVFSRDSRRSDRFFKILREERERDLYLIYIYISQQRDAVDFIE